MKNKILIDIDDEREGNPVSIQKTSDADRPDNEEEAKELLSKDIETVCEGLMTLFSAASDHGVSDRERNVRYTIKHLLSTYPRTKYYDDLKKILYNEKKGRKLEIEERREMLVDNKKRPERSKTLKKIN